MRTRGDMQQTPHAALSRPWTVHLGRFFGIDVRLHATFLLLLAYVGISAAIDSGAGAGLRQVIWLSALFGSVVLHEYGHALTARALGIGTRDITLYPIGGVAQLDDIPRSPRGEMLVAVAGPAVNFVLAIVLVCGHLLFGGAPAGGGIGWALQLAAMNLVLGVFNLIPAFPMDGGRVLRALLSAGGDRVKATRYAARVGQGIAFALGLYGVFNNPMLVLLAAFVAFAASREAKAVEQEARLADVRVGNAMERDVRVLSPWATLEEALAVARESALRGKSFFPVASGGAVVGAVDANALMRAYTSLGPRAYVADAMERDVLVLRPTDSLASAIAQLRARGANVGAFFGAPVVVAGRLVGALTPAGLQRFAMMG